MLVFTLLVVLVHNTANIPEHKLSVSYRLLVVTVPY